MTPLSADTELVRIACRFASDYVRGHKGIGELYPSLLEVKDAIACLVLIRGVTYPGVRFWQGSDPEPTLILVGEPPKKPTPYRAHNPKEKYELISVREGMATGYEAPVWRWPNFTLRPVETLGTDFHDITIAPLK